jgi:hypothetical protein
MIALQAREPHARLGLRARRRRRLRARLRERELGRTARSSAAVLPAPLPPLSPLPPPPSSPSSSEPQLASSSARNALSERVPSPTEAGRRGMRAAASSAAA